MEIKTKYITPDDFKMYFGKDLGAELKVDDNESDELNAFLRRIEVRLSAYLDAHFYRKVDFEYPKFTDYQKEHYKYALLEQAWYVLTQGDISEDSGYDSEKGIIAPKNTLESLKISSNAKEQLLLCGLWCRRIKNRGRSSLDGWWMY